MEILHVTSEIASNPHFQTDTQITFSIVINEILEINNKFLFILQNTNIFTAISMASQRSDRIIQKSQKQKIFLFIFATK